MTIACADCGAEQRLPELHGNTVAECLRCGRVLDGADSNLLVAFAWVGTLFFLLLAANVVPVASTTLAGQTHTAHIISGVHELFAEGWPFLACLFGLFTIVIPLVYTGVLTTVIGLLCFNNRPPWLGACYRHCESLRLWAMPDVLVLAGAVIFIRAAVMLSANVLVGGWCLVAAAALTLPIPWVLSSHHAWRRILEDNDVSPDVPAASCDHCNYVLPLAAEHTHCPRCGKTLHLRKPNSVMRTTAFLLASYILFFPAYYFPMSYAVRPGGVKNHTIVTGIERLFSADYWLAGIIIFVASVAIPMLKIVGLSWMLLSIRYPTMRGLVLRTHLHRIIDKIGHWSFTDPFVVTLMAPLITYPGLAEVHVGKAAIAFALVVLCTMLATRTFDPRLMWDAAEKHL